MNSQLADLSLWYDLMVSCVLYVECHFAYAHVALASGYLSQHFSAVRWRKRNYSDPVPWNCFPKRSDCFYRNVVYGRKSPFRRWCRCWFLRNYWLLLNMESFEIGTVGNVFVLQMSRQTRKQSSLTSFINLASMSCPI